MFSLKRFPYFQQRDAMDCGPTCLMMIAAHLGQRYSLPYLRDLCHISREGVSALGITEGAESIGFRAMTVKVPFEAKEEACLLAAPLPCVAHWNQQHFVVIYKVTRHHVWIADPADGKFKLKRADFEKSWCSDGKEGVVILLEETPAFYHKSPFNSGLTTHFAYLFQYLRPYRRLISNVVIGMLLTSLFQLIFPFLTQSVVDIGIQNRNIGFVSMVLFAQTMLFLSQTTVAFLQNRILMHMGTRINVALVTDFLIKLMRLPLGFFDTKMTGDLMQRIGDQSRIEGFLTQSSLAILFSLINFGVFSIVLLFYNLRIFLIFMAAAILYLLWIAFFLHRRKAIAHNIAESDEIIHRERLFQAVERANIQDFIETLPLGYNTMIGAKGNGISQGQKQRLLIARAVYKNPDFLFFDEATNALDANNERVIVENLNTFFQNRTVIVVAHRLSTVKNADQIVVLERGEVVEIGNHQTLVAQRGAYFNLVKNQLELGN